MATYYINPDTGDNASGDGTNPATPFRSIDKGIITIATAGGTLVLQNSQNHVIEDGEVLGFVRLRSSINFINEDDDEDYTKVSITSDAGISLKFHLAQTTTFKGMTFTGFVASAQALFYSAAVAMDITYTGVKLIDNKGDRDGGGTVFNISGIADGIVTLRRCVIDDCWNEGTGTAFSTFNMSVVLDDILMQNCGDETNNYKGNFIITTSTDFPITSLVTGSRFKDNFMPGDGGCAYFYTEADVRTNATHTATVRDCLVERCRANFKGGGFWFGRDVLGYVKSSTFIDCIGGTEVGAGAFGKGTNTVAATNQHLEIEGVLCVRCTSQKWGGAITCGTGSWLVIQGLTCVDCTATTAGHSLYSQERDTTYTSTITTIDDSVFIGDIPSGYRIDTANNAEINTIDNCIIQDGSASVNDSGATLTNITDEDKTSFDDCFAPLVSSAAYAGAARWWTGVPPNSAGEPYPAYDIDIGGVQSDLAPFHPSNL